MFSCCFVFLYDFAMVSWKMVAIVQNGQIVEVCGRVRVYWFGVVVVARCVTSYLPAYVPDYNLCALCVE